jgi:hypothetical protein
MSVVGTKRTNRAGLAMSVDWGRPEVVGREAKRRVFAASKNRERVTSMLSLSFMRLGA